MNLSVFWPFVTKRYHEQVRRENWELRGAIRAANEELLSHRRLINALRTGQPEVTRSFERVIALYGDAKI